jgi:carbamoyl-phosphate synthase large subunit
MAATMRSRKEFPILVSSAGRRVELISLLREDATRLGLHPRIVATDTNPKLAAACLVADVSYDVPPTRDKSFIASLVDICRKEGVRLLVPTIDVELQPLARDRAALLERHVLLNISNLASLVVAQDKAKTARVLSEAGIVVPRTASIREVIAEPSSWKWPVIIKPISGSSSIGVSQVGSVSGLEILEKQRPDLIVQEYIRGPEFTVNVFVDGAGRCRSIVPHFRREIRGGEVSKAITVKNAVLADIARKIVEAIPGFFGAICFQTIVGADGPTVLEINARFGGGFPITHRAGARFTQWLIELAGGLPSSISDEWTDGVWMLRYDSAIYGVADTASEVGRWLA